MKKNFSTYFALFCFLCLVLCLGTETVFSHSPTTVYGKVLRLHVLANSDSKEDQQLKLKVRDELLVVTQELFSDCKKTCFVFDFVGTRTFSCCLRKQHRQRRGNYDTD